MKENIKKDRERKILYSEIMADNALLEEVDEGEFVEVVVRYIKSVGIKEQFLLRIKKEDYAYYQANRGDFLRRNESGTAVAIYSRDKEGNYEAERIYDLLTHEVEGKDQEFFDLFFQKKFPSQAKSPYMKTKGVVDTHE